MSKADDSQRRVCCPHCGSLNAIGWSVLDWTRYVCPHCGTFKVSDRVAELLPDPVLPEKAGRFRRDGSWDRWLEVR